jgi:hypothetical protein
MSIARYPVDYAGFGMPVRGYSASQAEKVMDGI